MLEKREKNEVVEEKEYAKVFNYFHDEYTEMLKKFLERHDIDVKQDDCLIDYIVKTRIFMPQYSSYTKPIARVMYNEEVPEEIKYTLLMNSYKTVKDAFNE